MKFPVEYLKCPHCGHKGTIYQEACKDEASKPKNLFAFLEKKVSPIQDFLTISTPTTKVLMRHYDTCSVCGLDYCVRAEKLSMPTDLLMQSLGLSARMPGSK